MIPKFRAWSIDHKVMLDVYNTFWWLDGRIFIKAETVVDGKHIDVHDFIGEKLTLMQSTGLFDNEGVEIFEGDVVENFYTDEDGYSQKYTFAVVWEKGAFRRSDRLDETLEEELTSGFTNNHFVLSNIHEHPELLEAVNGH